MYDSYLCRLVCRRVIKNFIKMILWVTYDCRTEDGRASSDLCPVKRFCRLLTYQKEYHYMKTIAIITSGHFPEGDAGAVRIFYMAKAIVASGSRVTVLCRGKYASGTIEGIDYVSLREKKSDFTSKVIGYLSFSKKVIRYLKRHREVDVVYLYGAAPSVFNFCKNSSTSLPVLESSAPVGSSARITDGFPASALAIDTLCC